MITFEEKIYEDLSNGICEGLNRGCFTGRLEFYVIFWVTLLLVIMMLRVVFFIFWSWLTFSMLSSSLIASAATSTLLSVLFLRYLLLPSRASPSSSSSFGELVLMLWVALVLHSTYNKLFYFISYYKNHQISLTFHLLLSSLSYDRILVRFGFLSIVISCLEYGSTADLLVYHELSWFWDASWGET